jgi:hypothetical protein
MRPSVDDAHLVAQHIEELRQSVDSGISQESADAGKLRTDSRAFPDMGRRPEFQHLKTAIPAPDAIASVQYGPRTLQLDRQCDHQHQRKGRNQQYTSNHKLAHMPRPIAAGVKRSAIKASGLL